MLSLLESIMLVFTLAISLSIAVPLSGTLVRFRANYNPKGLRLDAEGGVQAHTGPVVSTYFGMLRRVWRIEGWAGLYKGLMPTIFSTVFLTTFVILFYDSTRLRQGTYNAPHSGPFGVLAYSLFQMLISLPTVIITYRAVTTPHKLPFFNLRVGLRALLTPTERRRPWILYLTPGLLAAQAIQITYTILGFFTLRSLLLPPRDTHGMPNWAEASPIRLGIYFVVAMFSTAIITPLEVIGTRLAIQRNHAAAEFNSVAQEEEGDVPEFAEFSGAEEDVIGLRNEEDPYLGLVDCAKRIIDEEGWSALYRAWWLTMLACVAGAFS